MELHQNGAASAAAGPSGRVVAGAAQAGASPFAEVAPVPRSIEQTGLPAQLLRELLLKHMLEATNATVRELGSRMALSGAVVGELVQLLRNEALLEVSTARIADNELAFRLSDRGRLEARDAQMKSGYVGPAPVPLDDFVRVGSRYSLLNHKITKQRVDALFADMVLDASLKDILGVALNTHRAMFVYGPAGTGKTYTISKLVELYGDACLIPHAIAVDTTVIRLFDPHLHRPLPESGSELTILRYSEGHDRRYVACRRPVVLVGGEMTLDQLEVSFEPETRIYQAPLQLKATNGLFIIDDMGRQQVAPDAIFNRWIVPMETRKDFLVLNNGQHFEVPFEVQLIFSSNINPLDLADEAFLRRIGFKVRFDYVDGAAYDAIWRQELQKAGVEYRPEAIKYLIDKLHRKRDVPMAPCHPRDLLNAVLSRINYLDGEAELSESALNWAWDSYFVRLDQ